MTACHQQHALILCSVQELYRLLRLSLSTHVIAKMDGCSAVPALKIHCEGEKNTNNVTSHKGEGSCEALCVPVNSALTQLGSISTL